MEVLNPIYVAANMTALAKMTILNIHFTLTSKLDGLDRMFPFGERDISEWVSRYEPKHNYAGVLIRFVGNPHVYQAPESNYFIAACAIRAHEALFNV